MSKIIRLTESELKNYIKKILSEQLDSTQHGMGAILEPKRIPQPKPSVMMTAKELYDLAKNMGFVDVRGKNLMAALQLTTDKMVFDINFKSGGAVITKRPLTPPSFTDEKGNTHGMGALASPLVIDYNKMSISTVSRLLKDYMTKLLSEQDYYNDPEREMQDKIFTPQPQAQPVQKGEPFVPYEKKGPSVPSAAASISSDVLARKIADIEKMKKSANFLQFIKTYGHTSKESWDAATAGGYAPYASPQLKAQAQKAGYFPYTDMADKRKETGKYDVGPNGSLIMNLKKQLTDTGFKASGNNAFVGKVKNNNTSIVFTDKGVTVTKKPVAPSSFTDEKGVKHGMGLLANPLVLSYDRINATTFKRQVMDYLNK